MVIIHNRGMKTLSKYLFNHNIKHDSPLIFHRSGAGRHLGLPLHHGKSNSVIVAITHSDVIHKNIKTIPCDFSSVSQQFPSVSKELLKKAESRSILTIVDNDTFVHKTSKQLNTLIYKTGLGHTKEQKQLINKVLTEKKLTYIANTYSNTDTHILYQTKNKNELISINNSKRLIQLVGYNVYYEFFQPLTDMSSVTDTNSGVIANILIEKVNKEGLDGVLQIINNFNT